jgi:hypothetical protein
VRACPKKDGKTMKDTPPHLKAPEEIERDRIPDLVEVLLEEPDKAQHLVVYRA